jgi:hypothetical protein
LIRLTKPSEAPSPGGKAVAGIVGFAPQNEFIIDEQPLLDRSQRTPL